MPFMRRALFKEMHTPSPRMTGLGTPHGRKRKYRIWLWWRVVRTSRRTNCCLLVKNAWIVFSPLLWNKKVENHAVLLSLEMAPPQSSPSSWNDNNYLPSFSPSLSSPCASSRASHWCSYPGVGNLNPFQTIAKNLGLLFYSVSISSTLLAF